VFHVTLAFVLVAELLGAHDANGKIMYGFFLTFEMDILVSCQITLKTCSVVTNIAMVNFHFYGNKVIYYYGM
jgi:hypothetical protein